MDVYGLPCTQTMHKYMKQRWTGVKKILSEQHKMFLLDKDLDLNM